MVKLIALVFLCFCLTACTVSKPDSNTINVSPTNPPTLITANPTQHNQVNTTNPAHPTQRKVDNANQNF